MIGKGGRSGNVPRISPRLNIAKTGVDEFARRLDSSFAKIATPRAVAYT